MAAHHVAACSASAAERFWMAYGRDAMVSRPASTSRVPAGVPHEQPGTRTGLAHDRPGPVVAVGALDPTKGHELAIEAWP